MPLSKVSSLSTREECFGAKQLGQIVLLPGSSLKKISIYLETIISDELEAASISVYCKAYAVAIDGTPTGSILASDSVLLSDIDVPGYINFVFADFSAPSSVVIVLSSPDGTEENHVTWKYCNTGLDEEFDSEDESSYSNNSGVSWDTDASKKFVYIAYSEIDGIDVEDQSAIIQAGELVEIVDEDHADWNASGNIFNKTTAPGDVVKIDFSNIVVTLVVDQSGSMTWNDNAGTRFDFLKELIAEFDGLNSVSSSVKYSIIKFGGRKIGNVSLSVEGSDDAGFSFEGVQVKRSLVLSDLLETSGGTEVYAGSAQHVSGTATDDVYLEDNDFYYYVIRSKDDEDVFSAPRYDYARINYVNGTVVPLLPGTLVPPVGVSDFSGEDEVILETVLLVEYDLGERKINLNWKNPVGYDYETITLVRRTDRYPESPLDGDVLLDAEDAATVSYEDTDDIYTDFTYYYSIFTRKSNLIKCSSTNARRVLIQTTPLDRTWEEYETEVVPPGLDNTSPGVPVCEGIEGDSTIKISWDTVAGAVRYKIWTKSNRHPIPMDQKEREYDGELVYNGIKTEFIHRGLNNDQNYYYAVVAIDANGNVSDKSELKLAPTATSEASIPPVEVSDFEIEIFNSEKIRGSWKNPVSDIAGVRLYFSQTAKLISSVDFIDDGEIDDFMSYEFEIDGGNAVEIIDNESSGLERITTQTCIIFANAPVFGSDSIASTVSMVNDFELLNRISYAEVTVRALLSVKNKKTGEILTAVKSRDVKIKFENPLVLSIESSQQIKRRKWGPSVTSSSADKCVDYEYSDDFVSGVYIGNTEPFRATVTVSFEGTSLRKDAEVALVLLDAATRLATNAVRLPAGQVSYPVKTVISEILDENGEPTGNTSEKSLVLIELPPSNVPGDFILQATISYEGYSRVVEEQVHYEPTLNIDLELTVPNFDGIDAAEQKAFVYNGIYDDPQDKKAPVSDFTITEWSIKSTCKPPPPIKVREFYSVEVEDVPVVPNAKAVSAYTVGGLAQGILWGAFSPNDINPEESYEVTVTATVGGVTAIGKGMLKIGNVSRPNTNRMLLRHVKGTGDFSRDTLIADGEHESVWEVIGREFDPPEDDPYADEIGSYENFVEVLDGKGSTSTLEDGTVIVLKLSGSGVKDVNGNITTASAESRDLAKEAIIIPGEDGEEEFTGGTASAVIEDGRAVFRIKLNARVPGSSEDVLGNSEQNNLFYNIGFTSPNESSLILEAYIEPGTSGSLNLKGGGGDIIKDVPPTIIDLVEPLQPS